MEIREESGESFTILGGEFCKTKPKQRSFSEWIAKEKSE